MGKEKFPKVSRTASISKESERKFEELFNEDAGFSPMKIPQENDIGIDYLVRLIYRDGSFLPYYFLCQLKSTNKAKSKDGMVICSRFPVKTLNLLKEEAYPSYVVLYDRSLSKLYWEKVYNIVLSLDERNNAWSTKNKVTIKLPLNNVLDGKQISGIYKDTESMCKSLAETKPVLDLAKALDGHAEVSMTNVSRGQNVVIKPINKGFSGSFKIKIGKNKAKKDVISELSKAMINRTPFGADVENGINELYVDGRKVYELRNLTRIEFKPGKSSPPLMAVIPETNFKLGPFKMNVERKNRGFLGQTRKEDLPWLIKFELDIHDTSKSKFNLGFLAEFANVGQFLEYLNFMKGLKQVGKFSLVTAYEKKEIFVGLVKDVLEKPSWLIPFFENLMTIENNTKIKFRIPNTVSKEEIEHAYVYAKLLSNGEVELPSPKCSFGMLGRDIKMQLEKFTFNQGPLSSNVEYAGYLCGEPIRYRFEFRLRNAGLDKKTQKLLSQPDKLKDDKSYSLGYEDLDNKEALLIFKSERKMNAT